MNIKDQVCSLELSKRLKELGINPKSYFVWFKLKESEEWSVSENWQIDDDVRFDTLSAFMASELGHILPNYITLPSDEPFNNFRIVINKFYSVDEDLNKTNNYIVNYECDSSYANALLFRRLTKNTYDPNLANAMAKMLIYLIEQGLINHA